VISVPGAERSPLVRWAPIVAATASVLWAAGELVYAAATGAPTGRLTFTQMAAVAELEAGLISERTKAALAAAKARGVKLGNPNGARALRGKQTGNAEAVASIRLKALDHAENLRTIVADMRAQSIASVRRIADELNSRGILTPRGGRWHPTSAARLLERLS
jgi:DNA invertase Pin-like site-specific DNA recombinase